LGTKWSTTSIAQKLFQVAFVASIRNRINDSLGGFGFSGGDKTIDEQFLSIPQ
jgi:hypothetical protein